MSYHYNSKNSSSMKPGRIAILDNFLGVGRGWDDA
jgi:hypothetical protein